VSFLNPLRALLEKMSVGVKLTNIDLQAIKKLYEVRWSAEIRNWKERDTDYCMWLVSCPDVRNCIITETGQSLADTITKLLQRVFK